MIRLGVLKENGYIDILVDKMSIKIFLYMGDIVNIESENIEFSFAGFMRKKGRISEEQFNDVKKLVQAGEKSTADILMTLGLIKPYEIIQFINEFLICALARLATFSKGMYIYYRIEGDVYPFPVNLRFNTVDAVKTTIFSHLPDEYFLRLFSRHNEIDVVVRSSGLTVESARLGPKELRYLKAICSSGKFSNFLPQIDPKNPEHIYRLKAAYYFKLCSFIEMRRGKELFESVFHVENASDNLFSECGKTQKPDETVEDASGCSTDNEEKRKFSELTALFEELKKKNLFERLNISEDANDAQVKKAYLTLAKKYHPDIVTVDASKMIKKCYEDIFALINEAYQRLEKADSRSDYLSSIKQSKDGKSDVDISAILEEEAKFIKAKALIKNNRNIESGLQMLEEIMKRNPDDEYKIYYIWGKYLKEKPSDTAEINKIISSLELIARKREIPDLFLFLGYLYKAVKNEEKMIDSFKRLLKLEPNNTIASIEIKLYEKKKK
ncbi:MAG: DnaJ domain-containing protein [Deltaproteobacteria bacterium]|nr:DnaJ domain-containing protein [Deltaproteobacteria bacterium]